MISSKSIKPGTVIEITAAGTRGRYEIVSVEDGQVTLKQRRPLLEGQKKNGKGRWWLDYGYVKANALHAARSTDAR